MSQEENVKRVIDLVEQGIQKMAEGLGVAVPHLWEVLVKQQIVEFFVDVLTMALMWGIWIAGVHYWFKLRAWLNENNHGDAQDMVPGITAVVLGIFLIFNLIGSFSTIQEVGQLINPEYYAIKDVAEFIKPPVEN